MTRLPVLARWRGWPYLIAAVPTLSAAVRGLARGWLPMGDNAYFAVRARDVLTEHHPLVGAWSSGSAAIGAEVNNLGPLQLDLLALPVRVLGWAPGTLVGVTAVNVAAACFVVAAGHARLGRRGGWAGALAVVALSWSLGSELLIEPRQHHALVLPFLAVLAGVWCAIDRDHRFLPWTAAWASLVAQTHLSFAVPLAVLGGVTAAAVAWSMWQERRHRARPARRNLAVAGVVLVVCWSQPVVDQLWGTGNLLDVVEAGGSGERSYGWAMGARLAATVVGPPDAWLRPAFLELSPAGGTVGAGLAALTLVVVAGALAAGGAVAWRRRHRAVVSLCATAGLALLAAVAGAAVSPTSGAFGAVSGNFRFLWPVAVLVWAAVLVAGCQALPPRLRARSGAAAGGLALVLVAGSVPVSYQSPAPRDHAPLMAVAEDLAEDLEGFDPGGTVLVRRGDVWFGEPYTYVVLAALQDQGVQFGFDDPIDVARFGESRRLTPVEAAGVVSIHTGRGATDVPTGSELVASSADASQGDRATVGVWFTAGGS